MRVKLVPTFDTSHRSCLDHPSYFWVLTVTFVDPGVTDFNAIDLGFIFVHLECLYACLYSCYLVDLRIHTLRYRDIQTSWFYSFYSNVELMARKSNKLNIGPRLRLGRDSVSWCWSLIVLRLFGS